jgi:hypothetical protein
MRGKATNAGRLQRRSDLAVDKRDSNRRRDLQRHRLPVSI